MVSLRTKTSVRVPSFSGPFALATALLIVCCFSEPFWQNFYITEATATNTRLKLGQWGACVFLRNTTGVTGETAWCTSRSSGWAYNFVQNATSGVVDFPMGGGDDVMFGLVGSNPVSIVTSSQTAMFWVQPIAALVALITTLTLIIPPNWLGKPDSSLFAMQKSGVMTIILGGVAFLLALIAFIIDWVVIKPAVANLNSIDGISAHWGNVQWYTLPCWLLMLPAFASVLMSPSKNEYQDL